MARELTVKVGDGTMGIFTVEPEGAGPHPAVVLIHHRDGVDEFTKATCERLAKSGFFAAAPNLYHRRPAGEDGAESRKSLNDGEVLADIDACVKELQAQSAVKGDRIAIMGHCMGGRMAYLGATSNAAFKAAVVLYGGGIFRAEGEARLAPIAHTPNIKCAVAGFFGRDDKNPSPEDVERISQELKKHSIRHDFRIYDGAGHAFQNFSNPVSYREEASEDAWRRLVPFLKTELR
ncbi:MAG TPA: dienelactone hydrolase family protein [Stellaceae bacterium]|nr:dienelactone hydrolase family protein [Stellaceae bacterium]